MNWGVKIAIGLSIFMGITIAMVIYSFQQDVHLVAEDYYKQEIAYQDQIEKIRNTQKLPEKPAIRYRNVDNIVEITFPTAFLSKKIRGEVVFFRPSNAGMDKKYEIKLDESGKQYINVASLINGNWKVKISWNDLNLDYYDEKDIFIIRQSNQTVQKLN